MRLLALACCWSFLGCVQVPSRIDETFSYPGKIKYEVVSEYSHIRIRDQGEVRTMVFVESNGGEVRQTSVDLSRPEVLRVPYTRYMFASFLLKKKQHRALILGMGGGAMIHFLHHHDPEMRIEAVEIDPEVVAIARDWFHLPNSENMIVYNEDAFDFIEHERPPFDAIYMDAFLKPGPDTGPEGIPRKLKEIWFLNRLKEMLAPDGVIAINLVMSEDTDSDLASIRAAFGSVYLFEVEHSRNLVAVAANRMTRVPLDVLSSNAEEMDRESDGGFRFSDFLKGLTPVRG